MNKLISTLFISVLYFCVSCTTESDLKTSVFIEDSEYTNLPEYTEWGYNTFGAYYDRKVFISTDNDIPLKVIYTNDTLSFNLKGLLIPNELNSYYASGYYDRDDLTIKINIPDIHPDNYSDLIIFNDTIINLENPEYSIEITLNNTLCEVEILNGEVDFKRAQNLFIDNNPVEIILSGTFKFQILVNNEPISLTNGRFDFGIGEDIFYTY